MQLMLCYFAELFTNIFIIPNIATNFVVLALY